MDAFLETERLVLRKFTPNDAGNLFELDGDPEVMRYLTGGPGTPIDVIENDYLPAYLAYYDRFVGYGFWAAVEKASGEFLGWFHFRPHPGAPADEPELGYRLRRSAWNKGYATEGSLALLHKGFTELGVRRVLASTYQDNLASRRVMEKIGMTLQRSFRLTPEELRDLHGVDEPDVFDGDDVEYVITKEEWASRQESQTRPDNRRS